MRYRVGHAVVVSAFSFFLATTCTAQGSLRVNESAIRIQFLADRTAVQLPVENAGKIATAARVLVELVDPNGTVRFGSSQDDSFPPGRKVMTISMAAPPQDNLADRKELLWYRLRYSVTAVGPSGTAGEQVQGILSASEVAPKLFDLHVAGPALVKVGHPAELRVRAVHPVTLRPIEGVVVQGAIDLDDDSGKPLLATEAKTDRQGFATLHFTLPRHLDTEDESELDIKVTGKLGDVSEDADGHLMLNHWSSVLLSTDKPMYQPGQTLHTRLMAFDQDHKAVANQMVTIQIRDPENSVVFRATPDTSRFGVRRTCASAIT